MDEIINGLFKSTHAEKTKKHLFKTMRVSASTSLAKMTESQQTKLLNVCIHYSFFGTDFDSQEALSLLNAFLPICQNNCYEIFTDDFFGNIIIGKYFSEFSEAQTDNTSSQITVTIPRRLSLLEILLNTFAKRAMKSKRLSIQIHLKTEAIRLIYDCMDHKTFALMCTFLLRHEDCIPPPSRFFALCTVSIHAMSDFYPMENDELAVASYISDIGEISRLISYIWAKQPATLMPSLQEIFIVISTQKGNVEPSNALGCLVEYIPPGIIKDAIAQIVNDPTITDQQMKTALIRMISWVGWPNATQAHLWVLDFFSQLESLSKYSLLIEVTLVTIKQVFNCLRFSHTRATSLSLLLHMLLSYQSSSEAFHIIVPHIPQMFANIQKEDKLEANSSYLIQLSNLCHCMIFLHSGFPELYSPILESLKNYPKPSKKEIKLALKYNVWSENQHSRVFYPHLQLSTRSQETGRAGLVNLGNTCFMNSVIQALFMIKEFRCDILKLTPAAGSVLQALKETFSYLLLTQREAYEPKQLLEVSIPSWFNPGSQQDCSEYLKYLLDRLNEEEKCLGRSKKIMKSEKVGNSSSSAQNLEKDLSDAASASNSMIEDLFHGKLRSSILCSSCNYLSSRDEPFVDVALPLNKAEERGGLAEAQNKNVKAANQQTEDGSKAFVGNPDEEVMRHPVQVEDVEDEEEIVRRSHKLEDLLHDSLEEEYMTDDNRYRCMQCNSLRDAVKTTHITSLPKYLIVTLLRFTYSLVEQKRSKVLDNVEIVPQIEVPRYSDDSDTPESVNYKLSAVVVHSGTSAESGHYYCYARTEDDTDRWCLFNDSHVSLTTFQSLNNLTDQFSRDTAYVLVYTRANLDSNIEDGREFIDENLRQKIKDDNIAFEKEIEEAAKRISQDRVISANVLGWNDDNPPPPPTCGGGDGQMGSGFLVC